MKKFACVLALVATAGITAGLPVLGADSAPTTKPSAKHNHHDHAKTQPSSQPASQPATKNAVKDSGNTKCLLMPEDDVTDGQTAEYKGVTYHFCCKQCVKAFKKNPEKYIKELEADPAKFGVKK